MIANQQFSDKQWFSASLLFPVLAERGGLLRRNTSVVLLRAHSFDDAFDAACQWGYEHEETYVNADDETIRRVFERVVTLDMLPENLTSGVEVFSDAGEAVDDLGVPFDAVFEPGENPPDQSGVSPT